MGGNGVLMSNASHYLTGDAPAKAIWHITHVSGDDIARVAGATSLPPLVARVLCARGMTDIRQIERFMRPSPTHLHDPFSMTDMDAAAKRIVQALRTRECILVHGDFDVDGVCGTALLATKLSQWGGRIFWFIPDRFADGYGVSMRAIDAAMSVGAGLILTVDCGVTAMEEITMARKRNMDVIVIDHHEPQSKLPPANAVLDPKRCDCEYPFKELSGTGVALKLLCAVAAYGGFDDPLEDPMCMDLTALATVADVVPLLDENRVLVKFGLEALSARHRIGVRALTHCAGLRKSDITSMHVAFILGPRLNAAGRLEHARTALRLLLTQDEMEAMELARHLNTLNRDRQAEEERTLQQALEMINREVDLESDWVIVLAHEDWHQGVIGIVASRIVERYHRPTILIAVQGDIGRGSARSIPAFDITSALHRCRELLVNFGGHQMAAGLAIRMGNLPTLRSALNEIAHEWLNREDLAPTIMIDCEVDPSELSLTAVEHLQMLEPCGCGNPKPVLAICGARLLDKALVGGGQRHLRIRASARGRCLEFIGFRMAHLYDSLMDGTEIDLCFTADIGEYNATPTLSLRLKDLRQQ